MNVAFGRLPTNGMQPPLGTIGSPFSYTAAPGGATPAFATYYFNPGGSLYTNNGPLATQNRVGPISGNGFGVYNQYDPAMPNNAASPTPNVVQTWKHNDADASLSSPQTRYSFFANGSFDITDKVQFYTNARFAESLTTTRLSAPPTLTGGWNQAVPYNPATDSPINPSMISAASTSAQLQAIYNAFTANPTNAVAPIRSTTPPSFPSTARSQGIRCRGSWPCC